MLNLVSETTGSQVSTLNLSKISRGERINLSKEQPTLKRVLIKLSWTSNEDVDATVALLGANEKAIRKDWSALCGYKNLECKGLKHSGDLRTGGTEEIMITLDSVEKEVQTLVVMATTHRETPPAVTFGCVRNAQVHLINADTNEALYQFDLEEDHSTATAVEMGRLYRKNGEWRFTVLEEDLGKHHMGLQSCVDKYFN